MKISKEDGLRSVYLRKVYLEGLSVSLINSDPYLNK